MTKGTLRTQFISPASFADDSQALIWQKQAQEDLIALAMSGDVAAQKAFWIPQGDNFQKNYREWCGAVSVFFYFAGDSTVDRKTRQRVLANMLSVPGAFFFASYPSTGKIDKVNALLLLLLRAVEELEEPADRLRVFKQPFTIFCCVMGKAGGRVEDILKRLGSDGVEALAELRECQKTTGTWEEMRNEIIDIATQKVLGKYDVKGQNMH